MTLHCIRTLPVAGRQVLIANLLNMMRRSILITHARGVDTLIQSTIYVLPLRRGLYALHRWTGPQFKVNPFEGEAREFH